MKDIVTINGQLYDIESEQVLTQEQKNEVIRKLGGTSTNSCSSCNGNIHSLGSTCTKTTVVQTGTITLSAKGTSGIAPYTIYFSHNGEGNIPNQSTGKVVTITNVAEGTVKSVVYTPSSSDVDNDVIVTATVVDSCSTQKQSNTETCTVRITGTPSVRTVTVNGSSDVKVGETITLTASCLDQYSNTITCGTITWSSGNVLIATVNSSTGVVTGISTGTATIYATAGKTGSKSITVSAACANPLCTFEVT